jgi:hypothetical protein
MNWGDGGTPKHSVSPQRQITDPVFKQGEHAT